MFEQGLLKGWLRGFVEFGVSKQGELPDDPPPVAGLFGGYFYLNLSHMRLMGLREKTKANAATVINEVRLAIRELFDLEPPSSSPRISSRSPSGRAIPGPGPLPPSPATSCTASEALRAATPAVSGWSTTCTRPTRGDSGAGAHEPGSRGPQRAAEPDDGARGQAARRSMSAGGLADQAAVPGEELLINRSTR